jgi:glycosyltransferase involved in cell wall biosynthesis
MSLHHDGHFHEGRSVAQDVARLPRLAIFTSHPIQYQAPLFRELARGGQVTPTVLYGSRHGLDAAFDKGFGTRFQWDMPLLEGYDHVFLENTARKPDVAAFRGIRLHDASAIFRGGRFDACLVMGWQTMAHLQVMRAAWRAGVPVLVRGESNLLRRPHGARALVRSLVWLPIRRLLYTAVFRRVDAFAVIGSRNAAFFRHFGVTDEKLVWAPYGVANEHFALPPAAREAARRQHREALRCRDETVMFGSVAKLIPLKRPLDLLMAFRECVASGLDVRLVYIGDGPGRKHVEEQVQRHGLESHVHVTGFVNQASIPQWYAALDCLVLPSDSLETWGLVVNEAMASGLPVIVSDAAGCAPDLVREGENGYTFALGDQRALAERMRRIVCGGKTTRAAMGDRSRQIIDNFTLTAAARAIGSRVVTMAAGRQRTGA